MQKIPTPEPIDDFQGWLEAFTQTSVLIELAVLAVCTLLAWALVRGLRRALGQDDTRSIWFGKRNLDGVLFPLVLLCLAFVARDVLTKFVSVALLKVAIPVLVSLLVIRVGVKVLQAAFPQSKWVRPLEQTISWVAWLIMVLWVSGLLPVVLNELDQIGWKVGNSHLTLRNMLEGALTAAAVLIFTLWLSSGIEARVLRNATGSELSLRKAVSNAARAILMFIGLIVALTSVGIDLTALSVLGGAVGVGIGLGLQKLAANYVSGFVILAERSMRIGDNVRVDTFEGAITQINARYTVIRSPTGRESIVPNEMLITSRVENLSLADSNVYQSTMVSVDYCCRQRWTSPACCASRVRLSCCPISAPMVWSSPWVTGLPTPSSGRAVSSRISTWPFWRRCVPTTSTSLIRSGWCTSAKAEYNLKKHDRSIF